MVCADRGINQGKMVSWLCNAVSNQCCQNGTDVYHVFSKTQSKGLKEYIFRHYHPYISVGPIGVTGREMISAGKASGAAIPTEVGLAIMRRAPHCIQNPP